jgi:hypothetical protein
MGVYAKPVGNIAGVKACAVWIRDDRPASLPDQQIQIPSRAASGTW